MTVIVKHKKKNDKSTKTTTLGLGCWDPSIKYNYTNFSNSNFKVDLRNKEFLFKDLKELGHVDT